MKNRPTVETRKDLVGILVANNDGDIAKVIEYNGWNGVVIQYQDEHRVVQIIRYDHLIKGEFRNPYARIAYGVGYIGNTTTTCKTGRRNMKPAWDKWRGMLTRCYSESWKSEHHTYDECSTCEEWHSFENFEKWFDANYYEVNDEQMELDKDILVKNNKIYSPDTCIFVPHRINVMFCKNNVTRGEYPIGVRKVASGRYTARSSNNCHIGTYDTIEEAFNAYANYKENLIKEVANEYKKYIPTKLYDALINYKVEITD